MIQENVAEEIAVLDEQEIEEAVALETLDESEIEQALIEDGQPEELAQTLAMKRGYFDGPIPPDIAAPPGLSPKRAELARFVEWRHRTAAELEHLEEALVSSLAVTMTIISARFSPDPR
jgi:hypothetical protein